MGKRGLNQIVTIVLIILIILVAIFILWFSLRSSVSERTEEAADITANCFTLNLEPTSCLYQENSDGDVQVTIRRNSGTSDVRGLKVIFARGGLTEVVDWMISLDELGTATRFFDDSDIGFNEPDKVTVTAIVGDSESLCDAAVAGGEIECIALPNCELDSAMWSEDMVIEGDTVQMRVTAVEGEDCTSSHVVNIEVFELNGDSILNTSGTFSGGEIVKNFGTAGLGGNYTFTARLEINPSDQETSNVLNVQQCELNSAEWGQDEASPGDEVTLSVDGNPACNGMEVNFDIISDNDQSIVSVFQGTFSDGTANSTWTVPAGTSSLGFTYNFNASLDIDPARYILSGDLLISQQEIELSSCGILNESGALYRLMNDVSSSSTCFTLANNSIILDGNGHTVQGEGAGVGVAGVNLFNVSILNLKIDNFTRGISTNLFTNSIVKNNIVTKSKVEGIRVNEVALRTSFINNTVRQNSNTGIKITGGSENIIRQNIVEDNIGLSSGVNGIEVVQSSSNTIEGNLISNNKVKGILLTSSNNNEIRDNLITGHVSDDAIALVQSSSNMLINNLIEGNLRGIRIDSSSSEFNIISGGMISGTSQGGDLNSSIIISGPNTLVKDVVIQNSNGHAIDIRSFNADNSRFERISISGTPGSARDLRFNDGVNDNISIIDTPISSYDFSSVGNFLIFEDSSNGKIEFLESVTGAGSDLSEEIAIEFNSVEIANTAGINNRQARISLYGNPANGFSNPEVLRNGNQCGNCVLESSITASTVVFTVDEEGTYSIGEV